MSDLRWMPVRVHYPTNCKVIRQWQAFNEERPVGQQVESALAGEATCTDRSLVEMMEDELDTIIERLMSGGDAEGDKGKAEGVAYCIALVRQPYSPSVPDVKNEAMLRWEAKQEKQ